MKKKIFNYLKENGNSTILDISKALDIPCKEILSIVNELVKGGFVRLAYPIPLSEENESSCYYKVTKKEL